MSTIDELVKANLTYVEQGTHPGGLPTPPARHVAVVTCMDARLLPARFLGLEEGEAHVIRNAGGRARDALRSLVISEQLLGTNEIAVIHHTDCGMLTFTNAMLREKLREEQGVDASAIDFLPFDDLEGAVRDDVAYLREHELIPDSVLIRGFVYDVETGRLTEVN